MYRAVAYACITNNVDPHDKKKVLALLSGLAIRFEPPGIHSNHPVKVMLNAVDVTDELFTPAADSITPIVSSISEVRHEMVKLQQTQAEGKSVVMEGRDIGLRVLPDAQLKIYLIASLEVRSKRRFKQFQKKGIQKTLEEVIEDTKQRDLQDTMRAVDPLKKLPDAWELDTTHLSQDQVIAAIKQELSNRGLL